MQVLQGELLRTVLRHLQSWRALAISSAVNKEWHAATKQVCLTYIAIPDLEGNQLVSPATLNHMLHWLRQKQSVGQLRHVEEADLDVDGQWVADECYVDNILTTFLHSSLALLSLCHLSKIELKGPINICQAVPLLPKTVRYLSCVPDTPCLPQHMSSSTFSNLPQLLCLGVYSYEGLSNGFEHRHNTFTVDAPVFSLNTLVLEHWALIASPGFTFVDCFPKLQHLLAHCPCDKAENLLAIKSLTLLGLHLDNVPKSSLLARKPRFRLLAEMQLRSLHLSGPSATRFHVDLSNAPKDLFLNHWKGDFGYSVGEYVSIEHPDWKSIHWFETLLDTMFDPIGFEFWR